MNISELVQAAHSNAVEKGWWDEERTYGELIVLVHSEVSEALEDYRKGHKPNEAWYEYPKSIPSYEGIENSREYNGILGKPCGIPSELADVCIRIFDLAGKYGWGEDLKKVCLELEEYLLKKRWNESSFSEKLTRIHVDLSCSFYEFDENMDNEQSIIHLCGVIMAIKDLCKAYNIDLDRAISEKMAYNATRPHRHGGKVL